MRRQGPRKSFLPHELAQTGDLSDIGEVRIEGGSQNLSRIPGLYTYPAPRYAETPLEAVEALRGRSGRGQSRPLNALIEEPGLYSPRGLRTGQGPIGTDWTFRRETNLKRSPKQAISLLLTAGIAGLHSLSCNWGPFAEPAPRPSPCDPAASLYIKKQHYISRDFVTEDGTVDYARWFESRKLQSSPCDPVTKGDSGIAPEPTSSVPNAEGEKAPPVSLEKERAAGSEPGPSVLPRQPARDTDAGSEPKKRPEF